MPPWSKPLPRKPAPKPLSLDALQTMRGGHGDAPGDRPDQAALLEQSIVMHDAEDAPAAPAPFEPAAKVVAEPAAAPADAAVADGPAFSAADTPIPDSADAAEIGPSDAAGSGTMIDADAAHDDPATTAPDSPGLTSTMLEPATEPVTEPVAETDDVPPLTADAGASAAMENATAADDSAHSDADQPAQNAKAADDAASAGETAPADTDAGPVEPVADSQQPETPTQTAPAVAEIGLVPSPATDGSPMDQSVAADSDATPGAHSVETMWDHSGWSPMNMPAFAVAKAEIDRLQPEIARFQADLGQVNAKVTALKEQKASLAYELAHGDPADPRLAAMKAELAQITADLPKAQNEFAEKQSRLNSAKQTLDQNRAILGPFANIGVSAPVEPRGPSDSRFTLSPLTKGEQINAVRSADAALAKAQIERDMAAQTLQAAVALKEAGRLAMDPGDAARDLAIKEKAVDAAKQDLAQKLLPYGEMVFKETRTLPHDPWKAEQIAKFTLDAALKNGSAAEIKEARDAYAIAKLPEGQDALVKFLDAKTKIAEAGVVKTLQAIERADRTITELQGQKQTVERSLAMNMAQQNAKFGSNLAIMEDRLPQAQAFMAYEMSQFRILMTTLKDVQTELRMAGFTRAELLKDAHQGNLELVRAQHFADVGSKLAGLDETNFDIMRTQVQQAGDAKIHAVQDVEAAAKDMKQAIADRLGLQAKEVEQFKQLDTKLAEARKVDAGLDQKLTGLEKQLAAKFDRIAEAEKGLDAIQGRLSLYADQKAADGKQVSEVYDRLLGKQVWKVVSQQQIESLDSQPEHVRQAQMKQWKDESVANLRGYAADIGLATRLFGDIQKITAAEIEARKTETVFSYATTEARDHVRAIMSQIQDVKLGDAVASKMAELKQIDAKTGLKDMLGQLRQADAGIAALASRWPPPRFSPTRTSRRLRAPASRRPMTRISPGGSWPSKPIN